MPFVSSGDDCSTTTTASPVSCIGGLNTATGESCSCLAGCSSCSLIGSQPSGCLVCSSPLLRYMGTCVPSCPSGYSVDNSTSTAEGRVCRISAGLSVNQDDSTGGSSTSTITSSPLFLGSLIGGMWLISIERGGCVFCASFVFPFSWFISLFV